MENMLLTNKIHKTRMDREKQLGMLNTNLHIPLSDYSRKIMTFLFMSDLNLPAEYSGRIVF